MECRRVLFRSSSRTGPSTRACPTRPRWTAYELTTGSSDEVRIGDGALARVVRMSLEQRPETQTPRAVSAAVTIGSFVALLYVIEFADMLMANRLDREGIEPRETDGLLGKIGRAHV